MKIDFNDIDKELLFQDERIAQYLKGKMTADEERNFLQELESNADLKAKTIAMARMVKGMKEIGDANDKNIIDAFLTSNSKNVKAIAKETATEKKNTEKMVATKPMPDVSDINDYDADDMPFSADRSIPEAKREKANNRKIIIKVLSAAASFALLIWAGIGYHDYRETTGLGEEYATVFASSQIIRGAGDNAEVEMKLAKLFENVASKKDMKNTLHELDFCWKLAMQDTYNDYTDYAPEIGWNLAIGHLKKNDKKSARKVLVKLTNIAPAGTAIGDKARELLMKVEKI